MRRVLLAGATGTIGRATAAALLARGWQVLAPVRDAARARALLPPEVDLRPFAAPLVAGERVWALVSCLASRSGLPADARAVDRDATLALVAAARAAGAGQVVLLSAICVQKPRLGFQHAKLEAEAGVIGAGLDWSIVRPTAYFKSVSGQIGRVLRGQSFLLPGDGRVTACKPISDRDLAAYLADCLDLPDRRNRILPIGGPGPALTPRDMGEALFRLSGRPPRLREVPLRLFDGIVGGLALGGLVSRRLADKAELARIGRYYATESMLVWDAVAGRYDAGATPETGSDRLFEHFARALRGEVADDRGDHAVFR
jgi:divinyl chlorophyllide a 8-vinyl-reductase